MSKKKQNATKVSSKVHSVGTKLLQEEIDRLLKEFNTMPEPPSIEQITANKELVMEEYEEVEIELLADQMDRLDEMEKDNENPTWYF